MIRRRVLDLCCGAGGAGRGYAEAGYEVTGVDIRPQPNYPYRFVLADAIDHLADLIAGGGIERYDLVHSSWPCIRYARVTAWRGRPDSHPDLLPRGRELLERCGRPWVMENVPEAPIRPDYLLCGSMFGLNIRRHRAFETSWRGGGELLPPCWHHPRLLPFAHKKERAYADAMGCTWMTNTEGRQTIPPAYTRWIGHRAIDHTMTVGTP
ncbi:DNA cytosine methyltransferase [Streptomyces alkaliphilus]|uniref:DNA cytosine methyltransferase n=1 Tax=Streptomyces alkaliphilus TaxID=1472722 RepID=A0A7W3Y1Z3_9ACTN|nr:DNA cytosine methyltransferase [Streptomyces alkaliphilus]MBB0245214.1 DNA cytosine methyltransferase [Streptomyces alkaliphilus]